MSLLELNDDPEEIFSNAIYNFNVIILTYTEKESLISNHTI